MGAFRDFIVKYSKRTPLPEKPKDGFKLIYTDSLGNKWFTINNYANLFATRSLMAWNYSKDSEYNLTEEQRLTAYEKMNEGVNKKDIASIAKIVGVMEAAEKLYCAPVILLNLATCYVFLNDEANDGYKDFIQDKKREIWESDIDCKAFFLQWSTQFTKRYSELQKLNVLDYLERAKPILDQINFLLPKKSTKAA